MRVLVANRGEIAVRIIRACRDLGFSPVVAYSQADRDSLAVALADEGFCIGPGPASASYLSIGAVLTAAQALGADAVHPGYGFLSENAAFARACEEAGVVFVGPAASTIELMGDKVNARVEAERCGVPVVPGADVSATTPQQVLESVRAVGMPAIVKAAAGGGGRGMRRVQHADALAEAVAMARAEAAAAFGDERVYVERFVEHARHVEVQVFGLGAGVVVPLGERDCSVQRRHQKLFEESSSTVLDDRSRRSMTDSAVLLAAAHDYRGAGTVEFLYDLDRQEYYFLEMNTRLQVEHGVTELALGIDIVRQQLLLAATGSCEIGGFDAPSPRGHVIECRVLCEDPDNDFRPTPGLVREFLPPGGPGIRVDSYLRGGTVISPFYDSMVAKILAQGRDRDQALARMRRALGELVVDGVVTNVATLLSVLDHDDFRRDLHTTSWFDRLYRTETTPS